MWPVAWWIINVVVCGVLGLIALAVTGALLSGLVSELKKINRKELATQAIVLLFFTVAGFSLLAILDVAKDLSH